MKRSRVTPKKQFQAGSRQSKAAGATRRSFIRNGAICALALPLGTRIGEAAVAATTRPIEADLLTDEASKEAAAVDFG